MANLGNTIVNGALRVNGTVMASALSGNLEGNVTGNVSGESSQAKMLSRYQVNRLTDANAITPKDASEYGGVRHDFITTTMTENRPLNGTDGHLLTMFWDNNGRFDGQFALVDWNDPRLGFRVSNTGVWSDWREVAYTDGNIASATKLASARTISTTGDMISTGTFDGSGDLSLSVKRKGVSIGQSAASNTNPWYKFASYTTSTANEDRHILFSVYSTYGDGSTKVGILKAHVRTNENGYWQSSELVWLSRSSGLVLTDFVLAHNTGTKPTVVELWCKIVNGWQGYSFDVIAEGGRTTRRGDLWEMHRTWTAGSAAEVTADFVQQNSTIMTLGQNITGKAGSADVATKLQTSRNINGTPFDGSANIRLWNYYTMQLGPYSGMTGGVYTTFAKMPRGNIQQMGQATLLFSSMGDFGGAVPRNILGKYF